MCRADPVTHEKQGRCAKRLGVQRRDLLLIRIFVGLDISSKKCAGPLGLAANISLTPR
jgi:hypothetical protein